MEEARCGAVFPGNSIPVLMIGGKCSYFRAKAAHISGHLPHTPEELEQLGVAGYLRNPFHQRELLSKINEHLSDPNGSTFHTNTHLPTK